MLPFGANDANIAGFVIIFALLKTGVIIYACVLAKMPPKPVISDFSTPGLKPQGYYNVIVLTLGVVDGCCPVLCITYLLIV